MRDSRLYFDQALHRATFLKSAATLTQCPADVGDEFAFCGRSNVGKSSTINCLTRQKKLARTSRTPGRTQLINFFAINDSLRLVDLPGYGYAKVPEKTKNQWQNHIDQYLRNRQSLSALILVMDIRHPMRDFDVMMLSWCKNVHLSTHVLLAKADKLGREAQKNTLVSVKNVLDAHATIQLFSATKDIGKDQLSSYIQTRWQEEY